MKINNVLLRVLCAIFVLSLSACGGGGSSSSSSETTTTEGLSTPSQVTIVNDE